MPAGASPFKVGTPGGAATPGTPGGSKAAFTLLAIESISATFDGGTLRPGSFRALGELRAVQSERHDELQAFELRLESVGHVRGIQPNPAFLRASQPAGANGVTQQFAVRVPPRPAPSLKPLTLLRYTSAEDYAPIPLRVLPKWAFADGVDRLELRVAAHPNLKSGLTAVKLTVEMPSEVTGCHSLPAGEWDTETRTLVWKLAEVKAGAAPIPLKAEFATGGQPKEGRAGRPLSISFQSDFCNLTGLQPRAAPAGRVGRVLQRFVSGNYVVHCP